MVEVSTDTQQALAELQRLASLKYGVIHARIATEAEAEDYIGLRLPPAENDLSSPRQRTLQLIDRLLCEALIRARDAGAARAYIFENRGDLSCSDLQWLFNQVETSGTREFVQQWHVSRRYWQLCGEIERLRKAGQGDQARRVQRAGKEFLQQWVPMAIPPEPPGLHTSRQDVRTTSWQRERDALIKRVNEL